MLLVFVGNTLVLADGPFTVLCPNYNPPIESCSGDAPNRNLGQVSKGIYNQHKAALALLDCDELPLRVFTDASFECPPDFSNSTSQLIKFLQTSLNAFSNVSDFQESVLRPKRANIQQGDNEKSGPRPVGVLYAEKESVQRLKEWITTHPHRARDLLRYTNFRS